jgi:hypothetical protein
MNSVLREDRFKDVGDQFMPNPEELIQALAELDPATFENVINTAFERRRNPAETTRRTRPKPEDGPGAFARWLAQRHMETDAAIERVVYLPRGAPNDEVRLLEVNRFLRPPDNDVIEPLDFSPDDVDLPLRVFVADITRDQWQRIQSEPQLLAHLGWQLEGNQVYTRG